MKHCKLIVLIHGAGQGGFVWDELLPMLSTEALAWDELLPMLSTEALAVDFPNRKPSEISNSTLTFSDYVESVIQQVQNVDFERLIIVTNSIGGAVGLRVAEYFDDKVAGFIGISSSIPQNGDSFVSCLPFPQRFILPLILKMAGTKPSDDSIEEGLCNGLNKNQKDLIISRFTPESSLLYTQKCNANISNCKKMYVKLTQDKEFPISMQDKMVENLKADKVVEISSGHLPMLSSPLELAKSLNEFCKGL